MRKRPKVIPVDPQRPASAAVREAAEVLGKGGLVAFPTDTVYGLGADVFNPDALSRIVEVKRRPQDKPIPIFIGRMEDVGEVARELSGAAWQLAERFWPGPLTLVLWAASRIPAAVTAGTGTVGLRIPKCPLVLDILATLRRPITGTSANRSGGGNPVTAEDVIKGVGSRCDLILDGGRAPGGTVSTVVDCTQSPFRIIREGAVPGDVIAALL